uniref:Ran GTPase-activating protein 1 n=1 Tax=Cacopsylla melanoneura TaxID=428564 RepID=A0A8D8Q5G4_9HEMI
MGTSNSEDINDVLQKLEGISVETQDSSKLSFAGHGLKLDNAADAKVIVDAIDGVQDLTSLCLEGNTLGVNAAKAIADALAKHKHFKRALWKDMFTGRMKTEIPDALRYLGNGLQQAGARLVELDLSDNAFGPIGVEGLADLLRSSCCFALEELKLNNNGLGITGCKLLSKALHDCYDRSKAEGRPLALKVFVAGRNRLENEGATLLAAVFKKLTTLERVEMPQNGIYYPGITALSDAFSLNQNLSHLNLNDNTITHKGAEPLGKALASLPSLRILNLGDCLLKSAGATSIAKYLVNSLQLEDVNLTCNEIGVEGGLELAKVMKGKNKLKQINLSENMFGEEGVEKIEEVMNSNGMGDVLVLEDDEGEASDEEDGGEDDSEEEEENDSDAEVDSSHNECKTSLNDTKNSLNESKKSLNESIHNRSHKQVSVADLLASPSIDLFNALGSNCAQVILDEINSEPEDRYLESMLLAIMKVSSLVPSTTTLQSPSNSVFECTKALYRALFSWASSGSDKLSTVTNTLLVHLGLIKSEDKSFKITYNVLGCLTAVRLLSEAKLLPPQTEEQLWACIKLNDKKKAKGDIALVECY